MYVESPFDSRRRLLCVGSDVSSRYTRRNQSEYEKVWEHIRWRRPGKEITWYFCLRIPI